jgi:hypothetical protein
MKIILVTAWLLSTFSVETFSEEPHDKDLNRVVSALTNAGFPSFNYGMNYGLPLLYQLRVEDVESEAKCKFLVRDRIEVPIWNYFREARDRREEATTYQQVIKVLEGLEEKGDVCFRPAATSYLLTSMVHFTEPMNASAAFLAMLFAAAGKLEFLTPKLRAQMGGIYAKTSVLAGYGCAETKILIDPYQGPFDLAASMMHEENHFFLDKESAQLSKDVPAEAWVLLDETLSASTAAFYQLYHEHVQTTKERRVAPPNNADRSLFNPAGPLSEIWKFIQKEQPELLKSKIAWNPLILLGFGFMRPDESDLFAWKANPAFWENSMGEIRIPIFRDSDVLSRIRKKLYDHVSQVYFGKQTSSEVTAALNPKNLSLRAFPFSSWLFEHMFRSPLFSGHPQEEAARLRKMIFEKSASCTEFEENLSRGRLDDYLKPLGLVNADVEQKSSGPKAGSNGIRPGGNGIRPCLDLQGGL